MNPADFPEVWKISNNESKHGKKITLLLIGIKIIGGSAAIFCALLYSYVPYINLILAAGLFCVIFSESLLWAKNPESLWYEGRAAAESAKTLAWRYSVGADPFPLNMADSAAEKLFYERMNLIFGKTSNNIIFDISQPMVTRKMNALRGNSFEERRRIYIKSRTMEQQKWYADKARSNKRKSNIWKFLLVFAEITALLFAIVHAPGDWSVDLSGLLAIFVLASTAWVSTRRYSYLATAYTIATKELAVQVSRLGTVPEEEWAYVVADAEEAISREHTTWLASRLGYFDKLDGLG